MATVASARLENDLGRGQSDGPLARAVDRWIFVFMAAMFIVVTLTGFIPDALGKMAAIKAGQRPPFPLVLHVHAVLMASFLLLLLTQTVLMAKGRTGRHQWLGRAAILLVPAIVVVGFILVPTIYLSVWNAAQGAHGAQLRPVIPMLDDILLLQMRVGILFPIFIALALVARRTDPAFHKRMMILGTAVPLDAAIDRMTWLPSTFPASPLASDLYVLALVSPMLLWDLVRRRGLPRAYVVWFAIWLLVSIPLYLLWNTPWWHATVPRLMGV
jgi:hypothetical protein